MKEGDWVKKVGGDWDVGKAGIVLKVQENGAGTLLVTVYVNNEIKSWAGHLVQVISEGPQRRQENV